MTLKHLNIFVVPLESQISTQCDQHIVVFLSTLAKHALEALYLCMELDVSPI